MAPARAAETVQELRSILERRFPSAVPLPERTDSLSTGVSALDRVLPSGGLPRARITAWTPGPGETALLQSAASQATRIGERVAWVAPRSHPWPSAWDPALLLVRPEEEAVALECVELILKSGGFGLVVLQGASGSDVERVRLSRALKEQRGAFVWASAESSLAAVRVSTTLSPEHVRWRRNAIGEEIAIEAVRLQATVRAPGWEKTALLTLGFVGEGQRLTLEPLLTDRRGGT